MEYEMRQTFHQLMEMRLDPAATREAEWAKQSEQFIRDDQLLMLASPYAVHERVIIGPSNSGKTQISDHISQTHMQDPDFLNILQMETANEKRRYLPIRFSLGEGLDYVMKRKGKVKQDAQESDREEVSQLMNHGIEVVREAFRDHPIYTVEEIVEVVGVTKSDLGTSVVSEAMKRPNTKIIIPKPNAQIEDKGRELRNKSLTADDESFAEFARSKGVIFDSKEHNAAQQVVRISGMDEAWRRQWMDICDQIQKSEYVNMVNSLPNREAFLAAEFQQMRHFAYWLWLPIRLQQLAKDPVMVHHVMVKVENEYIDEIHYHVDKVADVEGFPFSILESGKKSYSAEEILDAMPRMQEWLGKHENPEAVIPQDFIPSEHSQTHELSGEVS
jgi:hypothetical protein